MPKRAARHDGPGDAILNRPDYTMIRRTLVRNQLPSPALQQTLLDRLQRLTEFFQLSGQQLKVLVSLRLIIFELP